MYSFSVMYSLNSTLFQWFDFSLFFPFFSSDVHEIEISQYVYSILLITDLKILNTKPIATQEEISMLFSAVAVTFNCSRNTQKKLVVLSGIPMSSSLHLKGLHQETGQFGWLLLIYNKMDWPTKIFTL